MGIKNRHAERFKFSRGVGESRKMNENGLNRLADLELNVLAARNRSGAVFMEALNSKYRQVMGYEENQVDDDNANVVRQRLWR